jgi:hypothetical protein
VAQEEPHVDSLMRFALLSDSRGTEGRFLRSARRFVLLKAEDLWGRLVTQRRLHSPELGMGAQSVGRTPWSARVPLDPLLAPSDQPHVTQERPTGGSAADQGVRPTAELRKVSGIVVGNSRRGPEGVPTGLRAVGLPHVPAVESLRDMRATGGLEAV